ncbi:hypothetical protein KOR34_21080 [Posidoniimonas corsicana]|uniref:DUF1573 domain-containing protein n=1 Tax=Posidoniimonas corsicana TaxID=1938618 RepID=A0A5C5VGD6_9BACT|nr:hypothetical protein KOR34_21080 [Posidoniimonas corsicana]
MTRAWESTAILAFVVALWSGYGLLQSDNGNSPQLQGLPAQTSIHLGSLDPGATLSETLFLRNGSQSTLQISTIRTSCGCSEATATTDSVLPGQLLTIKCAFDIGRRRGQFSTSILIDYKVSDRVPQQRSSILVSADIEDDYAFQPHGAIAFSSHSKQRKVLRIESLIGTDAPTILRCEPRNTWIKAAVHPSNPNLLTIEFDPSDWPGTPSHSGVTVVTDNTRQPTAELPVEILHN